MIPKHRRRIIGRPLTTGSGGSDSDTRTANRDESIDQGLRRYMLGVYNYMALGVAFTGLVALFVAMSPPLLQTISLGMMRWVLIAAVLGLGWFAHRVIARGSMFAAHACFWVYAALWGALCAPMFLLYTGDSMVRVFFIAASTFAGVSLYGYTTKRNLSVFAAFFFMSTIGILVALLVNVFFIQSTGLHLLLSVVVVLLFSGITAWRTQATKNLYLESDSRETTARKSIYGAFDLYGCFITLFVYLLQIFGTQR